MVSDKTETMVERVARAIYHGTKPKKPWDDRVEEYKDAFRVQARFAIDAMRDGLTGDMASAFMESGGPYKNSWAEHPGEGTYEPNNKEVAYEWYGTFEGFEDSWRCLFNDALKES